MQDLSFEEVHFPVAFQAADQGAIQAKRNFFLASKIELGLILLGAASTSWAIESGEGRTILAILGAISLGIGLLVSLYIKVSGAEETWFAYRAVAESVKTITWRYVTCAAPFRNHLSQKEADSAFIEQLGKILQTPRNQHAILVGSSSAHYQITEEMRSIRVIPTPDRKALYIRERLVAERNWYSSKCAKNAKNGNVLLTVLIIAQGLAMTTAILLVAWPNFNFNFSSIFSAAAAALIAWQKLKSSQELAYTYGQAAHEIGLILAREVYVDDENEFSNFVVDAENAISREHTMWIARRDQL
jgi:hypothetical protein